MVSKRVCNLKRKKSCLEHCNNWVNENYDPLDKKLRDDLNYLKKYDNHFDVNIEILILVSIFLIGSFIVYILFNMRN
jgi:hypothetical protein